MQKKTEKKIKKKRIVLTKMDKRFLDNLFEQELLAKHMFHYANEKLVSARKNLREFIDANWPEYKDLYWSINRDDGTIIFREKTKYELTT